jgi:hypothetical protein
LVPSITEKIDLELLGFILLVAASTIGQPWWLPTPLIHKLHAIKAEKNLIYLPLLLAFPVRVLNLSGKKQNCEAHVGVDRFHDRRPLDDEIAVRGHTVIHRSSPAGYFLR